MTRPYPRYVWPDGHASAFAFTVDVDAEAPLLWSLRDDPASPWLGAAELRRYGPRTGIHNLLDLLQRTGVCGTFYVPGIVAEAHPELLPALVGGGHDIGLHGYFHEIATQSSDGEFAEALDASLALFEAQTGRRPALFRSPAWEMTPFMLAELARRGLSDSSLMGFDHPYTIGGVTEVPVQWTTDDAVYFKFVGGGVDRWAPSAPGPILDGWLDEWEVQHRFGGLFMLTVHDWISGRPQRIRLLERLLKRVIAAPGVWIATVGEIAAHHVASGADARFNVPAEPPQAIGDRRRGQA